MKVYAVRFSNELYIKNPAFSIEDGLAIGLTAYLNSARVFAQADTAVRTAEAMIESYELFPVKTYVTAAGCSYEVIEVNIVEVV